MSSIVVSSVDELCELRRAVSNCVGLTSGVFDLFHIGHRKYLSACKAACDFLIVGVDCDKLVRRNKGEARPAQTVVMRLENVIASGLPDVLFVKEGSMDELLSKLTPNTCFVSAKRVLPNNRLNLLRELGVSIVNIPYKENVSTTQIINECNVEYSRKQLSIRRNENDRNQSR